MPSRPNTAASYALRVPRAGALHTASSRPRLAAAALAVQLMVPVIGVHRGLSPPGSAPCRAHQGARQASPVTPLAGSLSSNMRLRRGSAARAPFQLEARVGLTPRGAPRLKLRSNVCEARALPAPSHFIFSRSATKSRRLSAAGPSSDREARNRESLPRARDLASRAGKLLSD